MQISNARYETLQEENGGILTFYEIVYHVLCESCEIIYTNQVGLEV